MNEKDISHPESPEVPAESFTGAQLAQELATIKSEGSIESIPPEHVKALEQLPVNPHLKKELLLIQMGLKPATDREFRSPAAPEGQQIESLKPEDIAECATLTGYLDRAGLKYHIEDKVVGVWHDQLHGREGEQYQRDNPDRDFDELLKHDRYEQRRTVAIGRDDDAIGAMEEANRTRDPVLLGRAYGFPETAIAAFNAQEDLIGLEELKELVPDPALRAFIPRLSRNHWREELAQGQRDLEAVRQISPVILEELMQAIRKR